MFKFKVGDKVVLKEAGVIGRSVYVDEILNRVSEYGFLEVTEVGVGLMQDGYAISIEGFYYKPNQLWVDKSTLDNYCKLKEEPKLTPKLIESLDELKVGDYFKDSYKTLHEVIEIHASADYPIETRETVLNLDALISMGAYKVKVEPLEMVEVEEVEEETKPKLYELVEGESYVKLERGDIIKFKDGNVHGVHAVDDDDNEAPYCMYFMGDSWWVEAHYFLPENIISINGVNIHEEAVEEDPYEGWVVGAKVRCLETEGNGRSCDYIKGKIYCIGFDDYYPNDFGVVHTEGIVFRFGMITEDDKFVGEAYKHFELIKE